MAKYEVITTNQFNKDLKLAKKRGLNTQDLFDVVGKLSEGEQLPPQNHNHQLVGEYKGLWECHIAPDWLLIYDKDKEIKIISLERTGTHSDLFKKK